MQLELVESEERCDGCFFALGPPFIDCPRHEFRQTPMNGYREGTLCTSEEVIVALGGNPERQSLRFVKLQKRATSTRPPLR